jgi:hypothetical protein
LEGFLARGEKRLYVYTRGKETFFRALPEKVAKIHNYYSQRRADGTYDDRVEHMLQTNIEDPGLPVIRRLIAGRYGISRDARTRLAALLAIQEYRVPWMRQQMEDLTAGMLQRFTHAMLDAPGVVEETILKLNLSDEAHADATAERMRDAFRSGHVRVAASPNASLRAMAYALEPLIDIYFRMRWEVLESESLPFVTGDCPVHRYYLPLRKEIPFSGLLDKRVQVRFPLSPKKMLVMRHDRRRLEREEELLARGRERDASRVMKKASEIHRVRVSGEEVREINAHTMTMAAKYVFSPVEVPEAPACLRGECMNVRQVLTDYPGGITEFRAHYPQ